MISIKMHDGKWRIIITDEEWEFEDIEVLNFILNELIANKDKYGRLK